MLFRSLKKKFSVPSSVTAGLDSVAVRMPDNKIALSLIRLAKTPIAAPSANLSGKPSPTCAEHVIADLSGRVDMIIDGGKTDIGVESTVIDLTSKVPTILRPGKISKEEIKKVIGLVKLHHGKKHEKVNSPGMKYKHYAPNAKVLLIKGNKNKVKDEIINLTRQYKKQKLKVAVISFSYALYRVYGADLVEFFGNDHDLAAKSLYAILRDFDKKKINVVICEAIERKGFGLAIMDRLERASGNNVVELI